MISSLQENILRLAFERNFVTCEELLVELWKRGAQEQGTIDKAQYASRHAALSRSLTRLWMKDLIIYWKSLTRHKTAISLTPQGKRLGKAILEEAEDKEI